MRPNSTIFPSQSAWIHLPADGFELINFLVLSVAEGTDCVVGNIQGKFVRIIFNLWLF